MKRGQIESYKRLVVDGMELIPAEQPGVFCSTTDGKWHVPGRRIMTTNGLVKLAQRRGLTVTLEEHTSDSNTSTILN